MSAPLRDPRCGEGASDRLEHTETLSAGLMGKLYMLYFARGTKVSAPEVYQKEHISPRGWAQPSHRAERKVTTREQVTSGVPDVALSRALWEVAKRSAAGQQTRVQPTVALIPPIHLQRLLIDT